MDVPTKEAHIHIEETHLCLKQHKSHAGFHSSWRVRIRYESFGQCGRITKVVVNSTHVHSGPNQTPSVSANITFGNNEDALECIYSLENFSLDGNQLKASFGATRYCSSFLRGMNCTNPDCMYLHHSGDQGDSFSKDEITGSCR